MPDIQISVRIEQLWNEIERKEAYVCDLHEELCDAELELQGMWQELDDLRYQQGKE